MIRKEKFEDKINFLYDQIEDLKRGYRRENIRYIENEYLNLLTLVREEIDRFPERNRSKYSNYMKTLKQIGREIESINYIQEEKRRMQNKRIMDNKKNKKVNNIKIRKDKLSGLKYALVKVGLVVGGVILLKAGANKLIENQNHNKSNQEYVNGIIYGEDNFNDPAALKYFEEQGINKNNAVKDKVYYHIVCEDNNKTAKNIAKIYEDKAKKLGIKHVDLMSFDKVQKKVNDWNYQKEMIKNMMKVTNANYEEALAAWFKNPSSNEEIDSDKEHIFVYLRSSEGVKVSDSGVLFDELTRKALENNGLIVGTTDEYLTKEITSLDRALKYTSEYQESETNSGEKYIKDLSLPGIDASFIDLGISDDLMDEEGETIASSLLEATVMYNLKGSKVEDNKIPKIITDYDKVKFEIESKKR